MKLTDDEKNLLHTQYLKKFIPLRKKFDVENNGFYFGFDENQKMSLHKKRVEEFTKEILDSRVKSFIEIYKRRKKDNQLPEDSDIKEFHKELRLFVDARIKEFSETHQNNIFSSIPDEIINARVKILSSELPSYITEALMPLWEFVQLIKISDYNEDLDEDEYQRALSIIRHTMLSQSSTKISFKKSDENSYRNLLINSLNGNYRGQAAAEAFNKRGKTDILIRKNEETVLIAECKIWGREKLCETINQLLDYVNWHNKKVAVILFSENVSFEKVLSRIEEEIKKHDYYINSEEITNETFKFWFQHPEDENRKLLLSVLAFNIYNSKRLKN